MRRGKLTFLGEQPLPLHHRCFETSVGTVAAVGGGLGGQRRGAAGHQSLHTWGIEAGHALALIQPQLAGRVLDTLPLLKGGRGKQPRHV